ncbi:MAG TPA: sigma-70 family RNA polymerase sigma factor, partial [Gaiellaceae bacterium]
MVAVPSIGRASEVTPRRAAPEADATRDLYERYARQIYSYCLHQLGNREEAEDATQSTFLNAFRGFKRGVDPEFESAWLYKIAQNVCLTRQRSSSRRRRVETPGDLEAMQDYVPAHQADSDELIRLPEALDAMPEQQRRALLLREWQGLSYKEIGEELELSQAAVETLLFRARRSLAAGLSEEPVKKAAGSAKRLGAGGDLGSILSILKSLVLTGGIKVATAVATVAATTVVAATPVTRHAVEEVVAPRHDKAPVHQVSAKAAKPTGAPARVSAPFSLVPTLAVVAAAPAVRNAPLTVAASKTRQRRLALRAANSTGGFLMVGHDPSTFEPSAAISAPSVPAPVVETPSPAPATETPAPVAVSAPQPAATQPAATQPAATQPAATQPASPATDKPKVDSGSKGDATTPAAAAPKKDDSNAGRGTSSVSTGSSGKVESKSSGGGATPVAAAQPTAVVAPATAAAKAAAVVTPAAQADASSGTGLDTKSDNKDSKNVVAQVKSSLVATPTVTTSKQTTTTTVAATPTAPKTTTTTTT